MPKAVEAVTKSDKSGCIATRRDIFRSIARPLQRKVSRVTDKT